MSSLDTPTSPLPTSISGSAAQGIGGIGAPIVGASISSAQSRLKRVDRVISVIVILSVVFLIVDRNVPKGMGVGMLYPTIILIAMISGSARIIVRTAMVTTVLMWVGWFIAKEGADNVYTISNRCISMTVLWSIAIVGMRRLWVERQLEQVQGSNRWLMREVNDRVRDSLNTLSAICEQGLSPEVYPDLAATRMRRRVRTMLAIHNLLSRSNWGEVPFARVLEVVVPEPLANKVFQSGETTNLPARVVQPVGLILSELCWAVLDRRGQPAENSVWLQSRPEEDPISGSGVLRMWWREAPIPGAPKPTFPVSVLELVQEVVSRDLHGRFAINEGEHGIECEFVIPFEVERPIVD